MQPLFALAELPWRFMQPNCAVPAFIRRSHCALIRMFCAIAERLLVMPLRKCGDASDRTVIALRLPRHSAIFMNAVRMPSLCDREFN